MINFKCFLKTSVIATFLGLSLTSPGTTQSCNLLKESKEVTSLFTDKAREARTAEQAKEITEISSMFVQAAQHLAKSNDEGCELYKTIRKKLGPETKEKAK